MRAQFAWKQVFEALDSDGIGIADASAFRFIANFHRRVLRSPLPIGMLLRRMEQPRGTACRPAPGDFLQRGGLGELEWRKDLPRVSPVEGSKASTGGLNAPWFCVRVVETLLSLAETEQYQVVQSAFEYPLKSCPDVLAMSLAAVSHHGASWKWDGLRRQLISMLFAQWFSHRCTTRRSFECEDSGGPETCNRDAVLKMYANNPGALPRVLDIAQELKGTALDDMLTAGGVFGSPLIWRLWHTASKTFTMSFVASRTTRKSSSVFARSASHFEIEIKETGILWLLNL